MAINIKGMKMPESRTQLALYPDGKAEAYTSDISQKKIGEYEVVDIPVHGRLIDADALMNDGWTLHKQVIRMGGYAIHEMPLNNPNVPTVIPADKDGET